MNCQDREELFLDLDPIFSDLYGPIQILYLDLDLCSVPYDLGRSSAMFFFFFFFMHAILDETEMTVDLD